MVDTMDDFEKLKLYEIKAGFLSQLELAKFLQVSPSSLSDWKKNNRVPKKHLLKLEKEFGAIKDGIEIEDFLNKISSDENFLLKRFRKATDSQKDEILLSVLNILRDKSE